jgi:protein-disulfide isomerase
LSKKKTIAIILTIVVIAIVAYNLGSNGNTGNVIVPTEKDRAAPVAKFEVNGNDHILGDPNAPVTIIEYSDFECPFCSRFFTGALPLIKSEYVDTGKVKFIYRHFPLSFHAMAQPAAEASECAADQGMFWEYHDTVFENQDALSKTNLIKWAESLGLNMIEFENCLDSGKHKNKVNNDIKTGQAAGVRGTPATFVNGKLISGAVPFGTFQQAIEAEL